MVSRFNEWWEKTKWNWRRKDAKVPIHKWGVEKYLRDNDISENEFYDKITKQIRKTRYDRKGS